MPTTFSVPLWKSTVLQYLSGALAPSATYAPRYIVPYSGAQPSDPSTSPVGSAVYSSYSLGISIGTNMGASGGGVSALGAPISANASSTVAGLTWARLYGSTGSSIIDTTVSLAGGGGGVILSALDSTTGLALTCTAFSMKMPKTNGGTLLLNTMLQNRLVDNFTAVSTTQPGFGINTSGASTLNIYSGSAPADADSAATGTLLVSFSIGGTQIYNTPVGGSMSLTGPITSSAAVASGTAGYARWVKTNGAATFVLQGSVGTSGTDFIISSTSITSGNTYSLTDATISI